MERVDLAIIGSGPAGISAAITAKIRKKSMILYGEKRLSEKINKAHEILNYPGLPSISGQDLAKNLQQHLQQMDISITEKRVNMVYAMGDYFMIQTSDGQMQEADSIILACGMIQDRPLIGENEFLGRGVSYCVTCDAMFYKGKKAAVIGYNQEAREEMEFLSTVAEEVFYLPMTEIEASSYPENVTILKGKPLEIQGTMKVNNLVTDQDTIALDGIFILRDAIAPSKLIPGLEMDGNHVKVNMKMETNLPGLFACGDIAGTPYQYIKAAGQGNIAALSAVSFIDTKKREK